MIVFNYKIDDLINGIQMQSLYKSTALLNQGIDNIVDDTAISDEDTVIATEFLKEACSLIVDAMAAYSQNLLDENGDTLEPFEFDQTYLTNVHSIVFRVNMPTYFNTSVLIPLDGAIKNTLVSYVLYRMAKMKGIDSTNFQSDWDNSIMKVLEYLSRRTRTVRRSTKFI